jgi:hypothetical protein
MRRTFEPRKKHTDHEGFFEASRGTLSTREGYVIIISKPRITQTGNEDSTGEI